MRDESAAVAELSRRRYLRELSRNCMIAVEFVNSKTMYIHFVAFFVIDKLKIEKIL